VLLVGWLTDVAEVSLAVWLTDIAKVSLLMVELGAIDELGVVWADGGCWVILVGCWVSWSFSLFNCSISSASLKAGNFLLPSFLSGDYCSKSLFFPTITCCRYCSF